MIAFRVSQGDAALPDDCKDQLRETFDRSRNQEEPLGQPTLPPAPRALRLEGQQSAPIPGGEDLDPRLHPAGAPVEQPLAAGDHQQAVLRITAGELAQAHGSLLGVRRKADPGVAIKVEAVDVDLVGRQPVQQLVEVRTKQGPACQPPGKPGIPRSRAMVE